jgi:hypothetical protein
MDQIAHKFYLFVCVRNFSIYEFFLEQDRQFNNVEQVTSPRSSLKCASTPIEPTSTRRCSAMKVRILIARIPSSEDEVLRLNVKMLMHQPPIRHHYAIPFSKSPGNVT